jgi:hypothetical protein
MRPIRIIGKVIGIAIIVAIVSLGFGFAVMHLWNWLIPGIFHTVGVITFWQAVGLIVLCRLLFRGFGGGHWKHRHCGAGSICGGNWKDKWQNMTPEEREQMKSEWKGGWHTWKNKWHDMTPEDKEKMKVQWKERCRNWESRRGHPADFLTRDEPEKSGNTETAGK